jgi:hypothetical protein
VSGVGGWRGCTFVVTARTGVPSRWTMDVMNGCTQSPPSALRAAVATICVVLLAACGVPGPAASSDRSELAAPPGSASLSSGHVDPGHCSGRIEGKVVDGDVNVPNGATCELIGTRVEGNISIGHSARLYVRGVNVDGDVEGEGSLAVAVTEGSSIGGNLQVQSGTTVLLTDSHIDGDLSWEDQVGELLARDNTVHGNVDLEGNTGGVIVSHNTIGGDLSCQDNSPSPQGGENSVSGDEERQCQDL